MDANPASTEELRSIVGDGPSDSVLQALLARTHGDISAAANRFFDGNFELDPIESEPVRPQVPDDVLSTLFKTLEDVGRKLAERDQQLDVTTRLCDILKRRQQEMEQTLARADADRAERKEAEAAAAMAFAEAATSVTTDNAEMDASNSTAISVVAPTRRLVGMPFQLLRLLTLFGMVPVHFLRWITRFPLMLSQRLLLTHSGGTRCVRGDATHTGGSTSNGSGECVVEDDIGESDGEDVCEDEDEESEGGEEDEELDGYEEDGDTEMEAEDDDMDGSELEQDGGATSPGDQLSQVMAAVASAQVAANAALELSPELMQQMLKWEEQQTVAEADWRDRQSRMSAEFEERKRRLHEQQMGQRKRFRESCDHALHPLYQEGSQLCAELEKQLCGKFCRFSEFVYAGVANGAAAQHAALGPIARISAVSFGTMDAPLQARHCIGGRHSASASASTGILVTLEKLYDRNGISMLPESEDTMLAFRSRGGSEVEVPLRLLGTLVKVLSDEEAAAAVPTAERIFVVRYAGGKNGTPIEPVQILPEGLSLADYEISFAAGVSGLRVEHRQDGPVKSAAVPVAHKQVFAETPIELYTQEIDEETHNIVQVYFSDLRDEVAIDVLNLTGTGMTVQDAECCAFPPDATGAALNYKIIVKDARVLAVLYQEDEQIRSSPFVEHKLPAPGSFVTVAGGHLGVLQVLPRGLVVAREPRDLPEHVVQHPPMAGLCAKGKHPMELPGMVDLKIVQRNGGVAWPAELVSVPVCAVSKADSKRLQAWHVQWDAWVGSRREALSAQIEKIELMLQGAQRGKACDGPAKVSELTACYSNLEESQRELLELDISIDEDRLSALQRGIQRYAATARFG